MLAGFTFKKNVLVVVVVPSTVAVTVTFHVENGDADYYWRLDVQ